MTEKDIRELLEDLGSKVSKLAEETRTCKNRVDACQKLIALFEDYISESDWMNLYQVTDDPYIKDLMLDWGSHLFPDQFKE